MKCFLASFLFLFSNAGLPLEISKSNQMRKFTKKLRKDDFFQILRDFVETSGPSRMVGKEGHDKARDFIKSKIQEIDKIKTGKLSVQTFSPNIEKGQILYDLDFRNKVVGKYSEKSAVFQKWKRFTNYMKDKVAENKTIKGTNIIWEKKGSLPNKLLIVGAHYDTISHDKKTLKIKENENMPGADYNASGVTIALGIIQTLAQLELEVTTRVVFFDYQGFAYLGSSYFVDELSTEMKEKKWDILGFVNLEMLGHDSKIFDKKKLEGNMGLYISRPGSVTHLKEKKLAQKLLDFGDKNAGAIDFRLVDNGMDNSDNTRFWEKGFASVTFSQDWENDFNEGHYQSPNDIPEALNQKTFYNSYLFIAGSVSALAMNLNK